MTKTIVLWIVGFWMATAVISLQEIEKAGSQEISIQYRNQRVRLRGFPYQTQEGAWVLASQPHIKSCCLAKTQHIVLDGLVQGYPSHQLIEVEGLLAMEDGKLYLSALSLPEASSYPFFLLYSCLAAIIGFGVRWLCHRFHLNRLADSQAIGIGKPMP